MYGEFLDLTLVDTSTLLESWRWLVPVSISIHRITFLGNAFLGSGNGAVYWLDVGAGQVTQVATSAAEFTQVLASSIHAQQWFMPDLLGALRNHLPALQSGQCYGFILPPCAGGSFELSNFEPSSLAMHFGILGQLHEQIRSLADGTPISRFVASE